MKIKKLEFKDFGKHEHLEFDCDGTIVAISGPNGSGKSTIAQGITWLTTGTLPDKLASYIRNVEAGGERGRKCSGKLIAEHKGRTIEVERTFHQSGKSSVSLTIDGGTPVTKLADADRQLAEVFGVGKKAVASLFHIPQGTIENLFGTTAGRYSLITQLLDIRHVEKAEQAVEDVLSTARKTITDHTPLLAQLERQVQECQAARDRANGRVAEFPDHAADIAKYEEMAGLFTRIAELEQLLKDARQNTATVLGDITAFKADHPHAEQLVDEVAALRRKLDEAKAVVSDYDNALNGNARLNAVRKSKVEAVVALNTMFLPDVPEGDPVALGKQVSDLNSILSDMRSAIVAQVTYRSIQEEIAKLPTQEEIKATLDSLDSGKLAELSNKADFAGRRADLAASSLRTGFKTECPLCGGQGFSVTPERVEELQNEAREALTAWEQAKARQKQFQEHSSVLNTLSSEARNQAILVSNAFTRAGLSVGNIAEADIMAAVNTVDSKRAEANTLRQGIENAKAFLASQKHEERRLTQAVESYTALENELSRFAAVPAQPVEAQTLVTQLSAELEAKQLALTRWERLQTRKAALKDSRTIEDSLDSSHQKLILALASADIPNDGFPADTVDARLREFREKQVWRQDAVSQLNEAEGALKSALESTEKVREQMRRTENMRTRVEQVEALRHALGKSGASGEYVASAFSVLVRAANDHLAAMRSAVRISADPDEFLGLRFTDLLNPAAGSQPQYKLSGAQKVRVGLAFVLAAHDIIVRDVGCLIVDEVSNHLDGSAVSDVATLIEALKTALEKKGAQLWVIDHNDVITGRADKILRL
jgi:DNA repair exonuclease SbcCD ATPase subunit